MKKRRRRRGRRRRQTGRKAGRQEGRQKIYHIYKMQLHKNVSKTFSKPQFFYSTLKLNWVILWNVVLTVTDFENS